MAPIKLIYFPLRGRAEFIRYILAQGGADFEDVRIPRENWPEFKHSTPMGQVPVLEENGKKMCQSLAISRYCAKKFGLFPDNHWDAGLSDMMVDGLFDFWPNLKTVHVAIRSGEQDKKTEAWNTFKTEHLLPILDRYEKFLTSNGTGYLVGKKLSWVDLILAELLDRFTVIFDNESLLINYPNLLKLKKTVHELPNIKKYVAGRPTTPL